MLGELERRHRDPQLQRGTSDGQIDIVLIGVQKRCPGNGSFISLVLVVKPGTSRYFTERGVLSHRIKGPVERGVLV